jgi:limonene-1,2-epoxide hydrolase
MNLSSLRSMGVACGTSLILAMAANSFGVNLLSNPSFESPQIAGEAGGAGTGWGSYNAVFTENTGAGGTLFNPALPAHDGDQVIKTFGGGSGVFQDVAVTPGEIYTASAWAQSWSGDAATTGELGQLLVIYRDATDSNNILTTQADNIIVGPVTNNTWFEGVISNPVPAGVGFIRFQLNTMSPGAGSIFYDDASLTVAPAPEPASLGLLAVGGLAALRRKR